MRHPKHILALHLLRGPLEEVHISELLHLLSIDGPDHLLVVVEHPLRRALVRDLLPDERYVVSRKEEA
jgi:hypothetical protein